MAKDFASDYIEVKDRLVEFHERYPDGRIICTPPEVHTVGSATFIGVTATVYRDHDPAMPPASVGSAWEPFPGKTPFTRDSEAMNAETSAIGRALAAAGISAHASLASREDVQRRQEEQKTISEADRAEVDNLIAELSEAAKAELKDLWKQSGLPIWKKCKAGHLDAVHELIVKVDTADPTVGGDQGERPDNGRQLAMRRLFAMLAERNIGDDVRHDWAGNQLGREIASFAELSDDEISQLTDDLRSGQIRGAS